MASSSKRAQFHHHGHVLAVARGLDQVLDDRGILAGAVQGLLDRQHVRVLGGLADQLQHRVERIERVVQQHVALADRVEHGLQVAGGARLELCELQIRPVDHVVDLDHPVEVDRAVDLVDRVRRQVEVVQQHAHHVGRAALVDLQPHRAQVAAAQQFVAQGQREVVDVVLVQDQLGVAGHPELVRAQHGHAREQFVDEGRQQRAEEHEVVAGVAVAVGIGQADDPRQRARRAHDRHVALAAEGVAALQQHHHVQRLVEDLRERVRRVQRQRRQHRHDLVAEMLAQPRGLLGRPLLALQQADALVPQRGADFLVEAAVLRVDQRRGAVVDAVQQGGRRQPVGGGRQAEFDGVADRTAADLEELVEVGAADAQKAQPLQQRHRRVLRLRQHAEVEVQLRQLAVGVQRRVVERGGGGGRGGDVGGNVCGDVLGHGTTRAGLCSRATTRSGPKWQAKVLPLPTSLWMSRRAPCRPSTCLAMARPRPVPPDSRERLVETR